MPSPASIASSSQVGDVAAVPSPASRPGPADGTQPPGTHGGLPAKEPGQAGGGQAGTPKGTPAPKPGSNASDKVSKAGRTAKKTTDKQAGPAGMLISQLHAAL